MTLLSDPIPLPDWPELGAQIPEPYRGLVVSTAQMRAIEANAISRGESPWSLMHAAGQAVAQAAMQWLKDHAYDGRRPVWMLIGPGNNGGDGLVAAQTLQDAGFPLEVFLFSDPSNLKGDAARALDLFKGIPRSGPECMTFLSDHSPRPALVIDALFGIGLKGALPQSLQFVATELRRQGLPVLAVDMPSGVCADSGETFGSDAIEADTTLTFGFPKPGHFLYPGRAHTGRLRVAPMALEQADLCPTDPQLFINHAGLWAAALPRPSWSSHKYTRGHLLVSAGPLIGAARLAASAAQRSGAGLVSLLSQNAEDHAALRAHALSQIIWGQEESEDLARLCSTRRINAMLLGAGHYPNPRLYEQIRLAASLGLCLVLDAAALSPETAAFLSANAAGSQKPESIVLTPHTGEFRRMFPDIASTGLSKLAQARQAAAQANSVVVLKGADTVVAHPLGQATLYAGLTSSWLSTAGSGDVLAGLIGGLLAQGLSGFHAANAAVWMHNHAGFYAGPGLVAEDLLPEIRRVRSLFV